jgi:hypothetical protein
VTSTVVRARRLEWRSFKVGATLVDLDTGRGLARITTDYRDGVHAFVLGAVHEESTHPDEESAKRWCLERT